MCVSVGKYLEASICAGSHVTEEQQKMMESKKFIWQTIYCLPFGGLRNSKQISPHLARALCCNVPSWRCQWRHAGERERGKLFLCHGAPPVIASSCDYNNGISLFKKQSFKTQSTLRILPPTTLALRTNFQQISLWNTASPWVHTWFIPLLQGLLDSQSHNSFMQGIKLLAAPLWLPVATECLSRSWGHTEGPCFHFKQGNTYRAWSKFCQLN